MLPGLTADHHLFDLQAQHFRGKTNLLSWDAPGHGASRPWAGSIALDDQARLLRSILDAEGIEAPVLVGQSMGGYVSQAYLQLYPNNASGFVSVDSCPLKRQYYATWELIALKHTYWMYRLIPWELLIAWVGGGCSKTPEGRAYMKSLMRSYPKLEYCKLADEGYRALAEGVLANKEYDIPCPLLALCGEKDAAGSAKRYNREWKRRERVNLVWVPGAGHNANMDDPQFVNARIEAFLAALGKCKD